MAAQFTTRWSAAIVRVENSRVYPSSVSRVAANIIVPTFNAMVTRALHSTAHTAAHSSPHTDAALSVTSPSASQWRSLHFGSSVRDIQYPSSIEPLRAVAMQVHAYHIIPLCSMPSSWDKYFVSATSAMLFGEASIQTDVQHYDINFKNIDSVLTIYRGERWHIERFRIWGVPPRRRIWLDEL